MSQALSSTRRLGVLAAVGGLALTGLTACSSSKTASSAAGSTGSTASSGSSSSAATACPAIGAAAPAPAAAGSSAGAVTIYSADGLYDTKDDNNWYNQEFKKFTAQTGIKVNYVEDGSGGVETKVDSEKSNPKADVIVTLPPFIQKAEASGLLQSYSPVCVDKVDPSLVDKNGQWEAVMGNYLSFIYNTKALPGGPPKTWNDLLDPKFAKKLQYSTPGVAGDGTAVMIAAIHAFGGDRTAAFSYFKQLQANNVGPSTSTGRQRRQAQHLLPAVHGRPGQGRAGRRERQEADRLPAVRGLAAGRLEGRLRLPGPDRRQADRRQLRGAERAAVRRQHLPGGLERHRAELQQRRQGVGHRHRHPELTGVRAVIPTP
jgi:hypothetical protein